MKSKKILSAVLSLNIAFGSMVGIVHAELDGKIFAESFNDIESAENFESIPYVSQYIWDNGSATSDIVSGAPYRKDDDKSLKLTATELKNNVSPGFYISTPEGEEYETNTSYFFQTSVYIPDDIADSIELTAGLTYDSTTKVAYSQYFDPNGEIRKDLNGSTSNMYIKGGWNLITLHLDRQSATSYRYRLYVNSSCHVHNVTLNMAENSTIKDLFIRLLFIKNANSVDGERNESLFIDDIVLVKGVGAARFWPEFSKDMTSESYTISEDAVSRVPDNIDVGTMLSNISDATSVYATDENGKELSSGSSIKDVKKIVSFNDIGRIRVRDINLAKTIGGIVVPEEDFVEDSYDSQAWDTTHSLDGRSENEVLFKTENGQVTAGTNKSPYTVGGFKHVGFNTNESVTITKETKEGYPFYHFKGETLGSGMSVRCQLADLDAQKMQRGKETVVEFAYLANEYSHFNVSFRWKVGDATMTDDTLLGLYETECITFNEDGKIYLGGCREKLDPGVAVAAGEYETGKIYNVSLVLELPYDDVIRVKALYINGEKVVENKEFDSYHSGIKYMTEIDMYMGASGSDKCYDVSVANAKCYTTDDFVGFSDSTPQQSKITLGGQDFILLDSAENGEKFAVLSDSFFGKEKFDSNPERNHELLAKADFDVNDEFNIAYKLNDETNSESVINKLAALFGDHISDNVWSSGQTAKIGLLSRAQAEKYSNKIGGNSEQTDCWWLIDKAENSEHDIICNTNINSKMLINRKAHGSMYVRPMFFVDRSFFTSVKLDYIGSEAAKLLDNYYTRAELQNLYDDNEIDSFFEKPTVKNIKVNGTTIVGEKLDVSYEWTSDYKENGTEFRWYSSDSPDGQYSLVDGENKKEMTIKPELRGKYIKAAVIPVSVSNINPVGNEAMSEQATNIVYNSEMINDMLKEINAAQASELLNILLKYNDFLGLNLSYETDIEEMALNIMSNENIESLQQLSQVYCASIALAGLNKAEKSEIDEILRDSALMLDLSSYNGFTGEQKNTVIDSVYKQNFDSYSKFVDTFNEKVTLTEFNSANREKIYNLLVKYKSRFTADLSKLSDYQLRQTAARLEGTRSSFEQLDAAVTVAVNEVLNSTTNNNGGGGGGGSSSGKSSSSGAVMAPTVSETPQPVAQKYSDLDTVPWAVSYINELSDKGVISGFGDGKFMPDKNITREEFIKMLVTAFNIDSTSDVKFTDVSEDAWYAPYIGKAAASGIVSGYDDGRFGVGDEITREDAAVMIYRIIKDRMPAMEAFTWFGGDCIMAAEYATEALAAMYNAKILVGDGSGKLEPKNKTTRAMAAKIISLSMHKVQE